MMMTKTLRIRWWWWNHIIVDTIIYTFTLNSASHIAYHTPYVSFQFLVFLVLFRSISAILFIFTILSVVGLFRYPPPKNRPNFLAYRFKSYTAHSAVTYVHKCALHTRHIHIHTGAINKCFQKYDVCMCLFFVRFFTLVRSWAWINKSQHAI